MAWAFTLTCCYSHWMYRRMESKQMVNSRRKGAVGEREIATYLREHGFTEARRGQQFHGGSDSPDVVGMTGFHIEVKRVERLDLNAAMEQSIRDAAKNEIPVVFHRRDRDYWKVTMRLDDFMNMLRKEQTDADN